MGDMSLYMLSWSSHSGHRSLARWSFGSRWGWEIISKTFSISRLTHALTLLDHTVDMIEGILLEDFRTTFISLPVAFVVYVFLAQVAIPG